MKGVKRAVIAPAVWLAVCSAGGAEDWPQWRGPALNGSSTETRLPVKWSDKENVLWATALPGPGAATPVVCRQRVFLSAVDKNTKALLAVCLDAGSGEVLWQRPCGKRRFVPRNDMASPSPATDGRRAYFLFGTGDLAAFDYEGRRVWSRDISADYGPLSIQFGYSSSPLLYDGRLYVGVLRRPRTYRHNVPKQKGLDSYLLALDPQTGKTAWRQVRPTDARGESFESYATPVPSAAPRATGAAAADAPARAEIIVAGGDLVTGHDPASGRENWRLHYNPKRRAMWRLVPTPVVAGGLVCVATPRSGGPLFAVRAGLRGTLTGDSIAWAAPTCRPDVCTPLYYKGLLYCLDGDRKEITCLDPATGTVKWQGRIGGKAIFRASPTGADDKIYCISMAGEVVVLATKEFKVLSRIPMGDGPCLSTIAVADGKLFIRTSSRLHCVARPPAP